MKTDKRLAIAMKEEGYQYVIYIPLDLPLYTKTAEEAFMLIESISMRLTRSIAKIDDFIERETNV